MAAARSRSLPERQFRPPTQLHSSSRAIDAVLRNAKKLAVGAAVLIVMVLGAWLLASVFVDNKPSPAQTTTTQASASSTAPATTRLVRGALCEALVQAESVAGRGGDDPRERLKQVLIELPDYAAALSLVAREALIDASLSKDAELLAGIATATYDVSSLLASLEAASSDEEYASLLNEVRGLALSTKSLSVSVPVLAAYALSGCQSRIGLLP